MVVAGIATGCGKKQAPPPPPSDVPQQTDATGTPADPSAPATQAATQEGTAAGAAPPPPVNYAQNQTVVEAAASGNVEATMQQLQIELYKYMSITHYRPQTFEEFLQKANIKAPPAPEGKKFIIGPKAKIKLVDK